MGILERLGFKAKPAFTSGSTEPVRWLLPGTKLDYASKAGRLYTNSVVAICLGKTSDLFAESPLIVERSIRQNASVEWEPVESEFADVVNWRPNPWYDGTVLWYGTLVSLKTSGNAYWLKLATKAKAVGGYVYLDHSRIRAVPSEDGTSLIDHYEYRSGSGGESVRLERTEIVHFRIGMNPEQPQYGVSPLQMSMREICTDNELATYGASIAANTGVPSVALVPKFDHVKDVPTTAQREELKTRWRLETTGDNRGNVVMLPFPTEIVKLNLTPQEMASDGMRNAATDRICAAMGMDPMVVGLPSQSKTYSNYAEALRSFVETSLMPLKQILARQLYVQTYLPDWGGSTAERLNWDVSNVQCLQESRDLIVERTVKLWQANLIKRSTALALLDLAPQGEDDLFYAETQAAAQSATGLMSARARAEWRRSMERLESREDD